MSKFVDDLELLVFGGAKMKNATANYNQAIADAINKMNNEQAKPQDHTLLYVIIVLAVLMFLAGLFFLSKKKTG